MQNKRLVLKKEVALKILKDIMFLFKQEKDFSIKMYDLHFEIINFINQLGGFPFKESRHIREGFISLLSYYETTRLERNENLEMIKEITGKDYGTMESGIMDIFSR